jgi:hypothetical protein
MDYYFSDTRPFHEFIAMELSHSEVELPHGYAVFSASQKASGVMLKTLDFQVSDHAQYADLLHLAVKLGLQYGAATIEIPEEVARPLMKTWLGRILLIPKSRVYQCHPKSNDSPLAVHWRELERHLYDGDMAFS